MTLHTNEAEPELRGLDSESMQMVIETVRQLKNRLLTREKILEYDKNEFFPEETIREIMGPDIGLQLLFISEDYGGMGGGTRDGCAVIRELCKICLGIGTAFFAIQLGAEPIIVGGTEEQKAKWLGAIAEGNSLVAYAVTEPEAGSNLASLKTKAEPVINDTHFLSWKKELRDLFRVRVKINTVSGLRTRLHFLLRMFLSRLKILSA